MRHEGRDELRRKVDFIAAGIQEKLVKKAGKKNKHLLSYFDFKASKDKHPRCRIRAVKLAGCTRPSRLAF